MPKDFKSVESNFYLTKSSFETKIRTDNNEDKSHMHLLAFSFCKETVPTPGGDPVCFDSCLAQVECKVQD